MLNDKRSKTVVSVFFLCVILSFLVLYIPSVQSDVVEKAQESDWILYKRTANTDIMRNTQTGEYQRTIGQGQINIDRGDRRYPNYMPFENYINVTATKSGEFKITDINGKECFIKMDYERSNFFSFAQPRINITKQRGSWYFTTDARTSVNYMKYDLNCSDFNITFSDDALNFDETFKIDFKQAKTEQNITTTYFKNKLTFEITDGKTGDLRMVDPILTLQDADSENLEDTFSRDIDSNSNGDDDKVSTGRAGAADSNNNYSTFIMFNISSLLDFDKIITYSNLSFIVDGATSNVIYNLTIYELNNSNWTEDNCFNVSNCPFSDIQDSIETQSFDSPSAEDIISFNVTDFTLENYGNNSNNISFFINSTRNQTVSIVNLKSKEHATVADRPKLEVTYIPYIDINSPTPAQIFTQDNPTAIFNITTNVTMDVCYWTPDSGVTNYSLSNTTAYDWNWTNISMVDGAYTDTKFYCNQSDDGTWRTSDTVSFDVDSVNVTVCRDLSVSRTYSLLNNITITGTAVKCLYITNPNLDINLNGYTVRYTGNSWTSEPIDIDASNITIRNGFVRSSWGAAISSGSSADDDIKIINVTASTSGSTAAAKSTISIFGDFSITNSTISHSTNWDNEPAINDAYSKINITNSIIISTDFSTGIFGLNSFGDCLGDYYLENVELQSIRNITACNGGGGSATYNFINVTYTGASSIEALGSSHTLTRKWYFETLVNDSNGDLENAQVNIYNLAGDLVVSELTDSNGNIPRKELIEYINTGGTKAFNTPHTVNVSKAEYTTNSTILNLTLENNFFHYVTLQTLSQAPTTTLQTPVDGFNSSSLTNTMICNQTDTDGNLVNSTIFTYLNGVEESTQTTNVNGSSNQTTYTDFGFISQGTYEWNCLTCDSEECAFAGSNFTLNIDVISPSATLDTPLNNSNSTNSNQNFSVDLTDNLGIKNATLFIFNATDIVNKTTENFDVGVTTKALGFVVNLIDGIYKWFYNIFDWAGNSDTTSNNTITLDSTAPVITITFPIDEASYSFNQSFNLNYTVSDNLIGLSSCWWTNNAGDTNNTITCGQNITQNLSDGTYKYIFYSNDTLENEGSDEVDFTISTVAPAVTLDYPTEDLFLNTQSIQFNVTATDGDGIDTCDLYGNWTGSFILNQSINPSSGVETNFTVIDITDGTYIWNVFCNDTVDSGTFHVNNHTFTVDTTFPDIVDNQFTPIEVNNNDDVTIQANATDLNLGTVFIQINRSGNYENVSFTSVSDDTYSFLLSSTFISNFENISWRWWANDSSNNFNSTDLNSFVVTNRNPYNVQIVNANNSFINASTWEISFSSTDDDLDTLNFSLYNSTDGVTFSLFNSTNGSSLVFSGFNSTDTAIHYYYITANDTVLQNLSDTQVFTMDNTPPTIAITLPLASPVRQCSLTNIPLNYSAGDTNLDFCDFNVTSGGVLSTPHTVTDCSNTTFNVSFDNTVQVLRLRSIDKAGIATSLNRLVFFDTDSSECTPLSDGTTGGGSAVVEPTEDLFCGDGICSSDREDFFKCPEDCGASFTFETFNLDSLIFNCFDSEKTDECVWFTNPGLLVVFGFVFFLLLFSFLFNFNPKSPIKSRLVLKPRFKKYRRRFR